MKKFHPESEPSFVQQEQLIFLKAQDNNLNPNHFILRIQ